MSKPTVKWDVFLFEQLSTTMLYQILQLRSEVFVVEQNCVYQDIDNKDIEHQTRHVVGSIQGEVVSYARVLAPCVSYDQFSSIGRVVVKSTMRGGDIGNQLVNCAINESVKSWPDYPIKISAQEPLISFYQQFGFKCVSDVYLEDDIPHIAMVASRANT